MVVGRMPNRPSGTQASSWQIRGLRSSIAHGSIEKVASPEEDCGMATPKIVFAHRRGYTAGSFGPTRHRQLNRIHIISLGIPDEPHIEEG
jgi:hypothetical protein